VDRLAAKGLAMAANQPKARGDDRDGDADYPVEPEVFKEEHPLDNAIVCGAAAAQDEAKGDPEEEVEDALTHLRPPI